MRECLALALLALLGVLGLARLFVVVERSQIPKLQHVVTFCEQHPPTTVRDARECFMAQKELHDILREAR